MHNTIPPASQKPSGSPIGSAGGMAHKHGKQQSNPTSHTQTHTGALAEDVALSKQKISTRHAEPVVPLETTGGKIAVIANETDLTAAIDSLLQSAPLLNGKRDTAVVAWLGSEFGRMILNATPRAGDNAPAAATPAKFVTYLHDANQGRLNESALQSLLQGFFVGLRTQKDETETQGDGIAISFVKLGDSNEAAIEKIRSALDSKTYTDTFIDFVTEQADAAACHQTLSGFVQSFEAKDKLPSETREAEPQDSKQEIPAHTVPLSSRPTETPSVSVLHASTGSYREKRRVAVKAAVDAAVREIVTNNPFDPKHANAVRYLAAHSGWGATKDLVRALLNQPRTDPTQYRRCTAIAIALLEVGGLDPAEIDVFVEDVLADRIAGKDAPAKIAPHQGTREFDQIGILSAQLSGPLRTRLLRAINVNTQISDAERTALQIAVTRGKEHGNEFFSKKAGTDLGNKDKSIVSVMLKEAEIRKKMLEARTLDEAYGLLKTYLTSESPTPKARGLFIEMLLQRITTTEEVTALLGEKIPNKPEFEELRRGLAEHLKELTSPSPSGAQDGKPKTLNERSVELWPRTLSLARNKNQKYTLDRAMQAIVSMDFEIPGEPLKGTEKLLHFGSCLAVQFDGIAVETEIAKKLMDSAIATDNGTNSMKRAAQAFGLTRPNTTERGQLLKHMLQHTQNQPLRRMQLLDALGFAYTEDPPPGAAGKPSLEVFNGSIRRFCESLGFQLHADHRAAMIADPKALSGKDKELIGQAMQQGKAYRKNIDAARALKNEVRTKNTLAMRVACLITRGEDARMRSPAEFQAQMQCFIEGLSQDGIPEATAHVEELAHDNNVSTPLRPLYAKLAEALKAASPQVPGRRPSDSKVEVEAEDGAEDPDNPEEQRIEF